MERIQTILRRTLIINLLDDCKASFKQVVIILDMNDGDFRVVVQNKNVHRIIPTYQKLDGRIPKIINEQDLVCINRVLLPVIEIYKMNWGEFKVTVLNRCVGDVIPMFDYQVYKTQNKK